MSKIELENLTNITGQEATALQTINDNYSLIEEAIENTFSLDGTAPNTVNTDIDLNGNDILNAGVVGVDTLFLDGVLTKGPLLAKGDQGEAGTITIGAVTTLPPGGTSTVVNVGTPENAILNFALPQGATGATGTGSGDMVRTNNLSDVTNVMTSFNNIKQDATDSYSGVLEIATGAEVSSLADNSRAVTPLGLKSFLDTIFMGKVFDYTGSTEPPLHVFARGQTLSRTTYAAYFAIVGTTYGAGDGSTTFHVPDLRGRVVAGRDNMGGPSADRLTGQSFGINGDNLGEAGGRESHTLTEAQLAPHSHTMTLSRHYGANESGGRKGWDTGDRTAGSASNNTDSRGSGEAHNNVQPTFILNKIIYVGA